jgi:hypothetical protein
MEFTAQQKISGMSGENHRHCFVSAALQQLAKNDTADEALSELRQQQQALKDELNIVNGAIVALRHGDV